MRTLMLSLTVLLAASAASAAPSDREFYSGATLYQRCASAEPAMHGACRAYVLGVSDALQAGQGAAPVTGPSRAAAVCLAEDSSPDQLLQRVAAYLENHSEMRALAAADLVYLALKDAYPCH